MSPTKALFLPRGFPKVVWYGSMWSLVIVVYEEYPAICVHPLLPALGKGTQVILAPPGQVRGQGPGVKVGVRGQGGWTGGQVLMCSAYRWLESEVARWAVGQVIRGAGDRVERITFYLLVEF